MLLLFLSIFFQYDLLHWAANGKDELLDYSTTEFWWNGTTGINQTDQITRPFLPTTMDWLGTLFDANLEATTTRRSFPFDNENYKLIRPPPPNSWLKQYPGLTPPSNFSANFQYPFMYRNLQLKYNQRPHKGPSFTLPAVNRPNWTTTTTPSTPTQYPLDYDPDYPYSTNPWLNPTTANPLPPYAMKWKYEISSDAAADSETPTDVVPSLSQIFNYDYTTVSVGVADTFRRIRKITQDSGSRQLKSSVFEDQTLSILREEITVIEKQEARNSEFENEATSYALDIKKTTLWDNESKALRVLEVVSTIPKGEWQLDQTMTTTPTTVKEFLKRDTVAHSYFEMIEILHEGYMMVFLIELTRLIATKERKAVRDVVKHTDQIIYGFYRSGQLLWSGPLKDVITKLARFLKQSKINVIQNHAANLHHMLSQRHQELSVEVNTILEYADMLYDDDEGRLLFDTLREFAAYPNISLTGYWLCNSLIHNFLRPYRRLKDTQQRQELIDSINLELKTRLTWSRFKKPSLRDNDVKQVDGLPDETKLSSQKEPEIQTEPYSNSIWSPRKRKRKRHHQSHKRKRERKRYRDTHLT